MRQGQFFIASIVLVTLTISITVLNLYIPKEISISQTKINDETINNALFVKDVMSQVINYFKDNWLLPYSHRTVVSVENNFSLKDQSVKAIINLPNNAYNNSLILVNEKGSIVPFGIKWSDYGARKGLLVFQSNAESLDYTNYYLYYNTSPSSIKKTDKQQLVNYGEDSTYIWVWTSSYYARLRKDSGGRIELINNSGSNDNLIYFDNILTCSSTEHPLNSAVNQQVKISDKDYYLSVVFTGSRFSNETYELTELFLPDRIMVIDEVAFSQESVCTWGSKLVVDKNNLMNYHDSEGNVNEPAVEQSTTLIDYGEWFELYSDEYGLALAGDNTTPIYASSTTTENRAELRSGTSETAMIGTHIFNVSIIPLVNDRVNKTKQYQNPLVKVSNEELSDEINKLFGLFNQYFYDINAIVTHDEIVGLFQESDSNLNDWYGHPLRTPLYTKGSITEAEVLLGEGANPNSIVFYDKGPRPYQVSTDNYHDISRLNSINNTLINSSLLLFNPNGQDFNITVTKQDSHDLNMDIYYPNSSLLNTYDVSTSPYDIELTNLYQGGFYNLSFNGTSTFSVNSTLPKTVASTPVVVETSPIYLTVNEESFIELNITTYFAAQGFTLYDNWNKSLLSFTRPSSGTSRVNSTIIPCVGGCIYRLESSNLNPFMISSTSLYISEEQKYLINPDYPKVTIISVSNPGKKLLYYNTSPVSINQTTSSDLVYSEADLEVNNSVISFDFDDLEFYHKGVDWFGGNGWITCTDSCTNSFSDYRFVEKGSERVVVWTNTSLGVDYYFHFYPNISYFKVTTNSQIPFEFGPGWSINGTDDFYYSYKGSDDLSLGDNNKYLLKSNLLGQVAYVTKRDELTSASVIFNTNVLEANNSIKVNDTAIIIRSFAPGDYGFLINQDPNHYLTQSYSNQYTMKINYTYDSSNLYLKGTLIN